MPQLKAEQICFEFIKNYVSFFRYMSNIYDLQMEYNEEN